MTDIPADPIDDLDEDEEFPVDDEGLDDGTEEAEDAAETDEA